MEAHCFVLLFFATDQRAFTNTIIMEGLSRHNSPLIGRKNPAKFENDPISRNGHRIKITQPNNDLGISFSSAEDTSCAWQNVVKELHCAWQNVVKPLECALA